MIFCAPIRALKLWKFPELVEIAQKIPKLTRSLFHRLARCFLLSALHIFHFPLSFILLSWKWLLNFWLMFQWSVMKAADVGDDVFGSCSRLRSREWGGEKKHDQRMHGNQDWNVVKLCRWTLRLAPTLVSYRHQWLEMMNFREIEKFYISMSSIE